LNPSTKTWIGQVTTGHGFMLLASTLVAVLGGTIPWTVAFPLLVAGAVGLMWPENGPLKDAAQTVATDLEKLYAQYNSNVVAVAANAPLPPDPGKAALSLAVFAAIGLSLTACSGQTPALQAAELRFAECLADTVANVALGVTEPVDPDCKAAPAKP
jgi:hypothetical protein